MRSYWELPFGAVQLLELPVLCRTPEPRSPIDSGMRALMASGLAPETLFGRVAGLVELNALVEDSAFW